MKQVRYSIDGVETVLFYCDCCGRQILKEEQKRSVQTGPDTHICPICKQDPQVRAQEGIFSESDSLYDTYLSDWW